MTKPKAKEQPITKKDLQGFVEQVNERFDKVDKRFDTVDQRFAATKTDMQSIVDALKEYIHLAFSALDTKMDKGFNAIDKRLQGIEADIVALKTDVLSLKFDVKEVRQAIKGLERRIAILDRSVVALDGRVRFQDDFPERLEKVENDVHALKLAIHRSKN